MIFKTVNELYKQAFKNKILFFKILPILLAIKYTQSLIEVFTKNNFYYDYLLTAPIAIIEIILLTPVSVYFFSEMKSQRISLEHYYKRMFEALMDISITNFFMFIIITFHTLLFILPGVWKLFQYVFVNIIIAYEYIAGSVALQRSKEIAKGNWWIIFLTYLVAVLPPALLSGVIKYLLRSNSALAQFSEFIFISLIMFLGAGLTGILYGKLGNRH